MDAAKPAPETSPETSAERQARQFAQLRIIGDFSMVLAQASGAAAQAEIDSQQHLEPTQKNAPTHAKDFLKAAAAVRQTIALELRVEAGPATARRPAERVPQKPDPRRPLLQKVLHDAVRNHPDRARRRREIDVTIEEALQADPDPANAAIIAETLHAICVKLDLDLDLNRIPDAFLDYDEPIKTFTIPNPHLPQNRE